MCWFSVATTLQTCPSPLSNSAVPLAKRVVKKCEESVRGICAERFFTTRFARGPSKEVREKGLNWLHSYCEAKLEKWRFV